MNGFDKKTMFRFYVYGYLNKKMIEKKNLAKGVGYKESKVSSTIGYLRLDRYGSSFPVVVVKIMSLLELPLSIFIILYKFFICFCHRVIIKRKNASINNMLLSYEKQPRLDTLLKKSQINTDKVVIVAYPYKRRGSLTGKFNTVSILCLLSFADLFVILYYSFCFSIYFYFKYRKEDMLFRCYSCYDFFLALESLKNVDSSNKILVTATYSRWAFLLSDIFHDKIFIQHGMLAERLFFLKKTGCPNVAYFFSKEQANNCIVALFNNIPVSKYLDSLKFSGNEKVINNSKINILLICRYDGYDKEEQICRIIVEYGSFNLYVKPHPIFSLEKYVNLSRDLGFVVLDKEDYPKVDVVVTYNSTLAIEYEAVGVKVIRHDKMNMDSLKHAIGKLLTEMSKCVNHESHDQD